MSVVREPDVTGETTGVACSPVCLQAAAFEAETETREDEDAGDGACAAR